MRISRDDWALELARLTAQRSTCLRRAVGCILLNARGHVLATGYNGAASGLPHCDGGVCKRFGAVSGSNLDDCVAIHAEQNALLQCKDIFDINTCYVTHSPCVTCTKLLLNTSCERIVFVDEYPHPQAKELWTNAGRSWEQKT